MKTGPLEQAITDHKYQGKWGWGIIFARVLLGHMAKDPAVADATLIIPMPTGTLPLGVSRKGVDHAGWIVESAAEQDSIGYPFRVDPPVIVKTAPTARMAATRSYSERRTVAADVYQVLRVIDPDAVDGGVVVVVDDVFTTGQTLNAVARRLKEAGARSVRGITLARQPWD